jgi:hypothetical protein
MSVVLLGSTSGSVTLQEPAIAGSTVIDLPATSGTMAVLPTATSVLPEASGGTGTTTGYYGFKNRIINGAMVIDQRNAGASVTLTSGGVFVTDRFNCYEDTDGTMTGQQVLKSASSGNAPTGFSSSLLFTTGTADASLSAAQYAAFLQTIEGLNVSDLDWGTANASTITLSFYVKSSLTGTFSGALRNSGTSRSYVFTYTISAANTWEQKTITIAGDTSGTWLTTNGVGISLLFSLGVGSNFSSSTTNAWQAGNFFSATGSTSVIGTAGATFYITGVQLEKGSTATSFDYRPYGTELQLCQRYYEKSYNTDVVPGTGTIVGYSNSPATGFNTNLWGAMVRFNVTKRATPTVSPIAYTGTAGQWHYGVASQTEGATTLNIYAAGMSGFTPYMTTAATGQNTMYGQWTASAEL